MQNLNYRYYLLMVLPFMLAMCLVKNLTILQASRHGIVQTRPQLLPNIFDRIKVL